MSTDEGSSVATRLSYLAPGVHINRRFVAPGHEVNTGEYLTYPVTIRDARPRQADFTLDTHGFTILQHPSRVLDFMNQAEVQRPWRVPHTAFRDTSRTAAQPRESIETRTFAYFL